MRLGSRSALARAGAAAWQLIGIAVAVILAGWAAGQLMPVLVPVGVALLLTALLRPVHCALERRQLPAAPAALLTLGVLVIVFGELVAFVVPPFVSRVGDLTSNVDGGLQRLAYSVAHDIAGMDHAAVHRALGRAENSVRSHLGGLAGDALTGVTRSRARSPPPCSSSS